MSKIRHKPGLILPDAELWLPGDGLRKRSRAERNFLGLPGQRCCCDCKCESCTCEACSDSPYYAPCCWKVVIAGIVDGTCTDCDALNKTYYLSQADDGSSYTPTGCSWFEGAVCGLCDPTDIWLTVFLDGSDYIIEVTMDGHVWRKNYGTSKPECCTLKNETIAHSASSGDCSSSSATCVITAGCDGDACETATCEVSCDTLSCPEEFAVDLGVGGWGNVVCDICDEALGVYSVGPGAEFGPTACLWRFRYDRTCAESLDVTLLDINTTATYFSLREFIFTGAWYRQQSIVVWESSRWDSVANPTCLYLADADGKIPLTKVSESHYSDPYNPPNTEPCSGTMPTTIQIWDANA